MRKTARARSLTHYHHGNDFGWRAIPAIASKGSDDSLKHVLDTPSVYGRVLGEAMGQRGRARGGGWAYQPPTPSDKQRRNKNEAYKPDDLNTLWPHRLIYLHMYRKRYEGKSNTKMERNYFPLLSNVPVRENKKVTFCGGCASCIKYTCS